MKPGTGVIAVMYQPAAAGLFCEVSVRLPRRSRFSETDHLQQGGAADLRIGHDTDPISATRMPPRVKQATKP
jgi:hypothetical protein